MTTIAICRKCGQRCKICEPQEINGGLNSRRISIKRQERNRHKGFTTAALPSVRKLGSWRGRLGKCARKVTSLWHIAKQLSVPIDFLVQVLESFEAQLVLEARRAVDYYRAADLERLQKLITHYLPLALLEIDRQNIDAIDAAELEYSLKAAHLVLKAIGEKARLLGLGELGREKNFAGKDVSGWLENNLPAITKLLTGAGSRRRSKGSRNHKSGIRRMRTSVTRPRDH
jgi:hypothetical protein